MLFSHVPSKRLMLYTSASVSKVELTNWKRWKAGRQAAWRRKTQFRDENSQLPRLEATREQLNHKRFCRYEPHIFGARRQFSNCKSRYIQFSIFACPSRSHFIELSQPLQMCDEIKMEEPRKKIELLWCMAYLISEKQHLYRNREKKSYRMEPSEITMTLMRQMPASRRVVITTSSLLSCCIIITNQIFYTRLQFLAWVPRQSGKRF